MKKDVKKKSYVEGLKNKTKKELIVLLRNNKSSNTQLRNTNNSLQKKHKLREYQIKRIILTLHYMLEHPYSESRNGRCMRKQKTYSTLKKEGYFKEENEKGLEE